MAFRSLLKPLGRLFYPLEPGFRKREAKYRDKRTSLSDCLWLWKQGFYSGHKQGYGLTRQNSNLFLAHEPYRRLHPLNGVYSRLIDSKAFLPVILPASATTNVFVVFVKGIERFRQGFGEGDLVSNLHQRTHIGEALICKPLSDSGGNHVVQIDRETVAAAIRRIQTNKESVVIQERVISHRYASQIFPHSANTVRLMLYRDTESREMRIAGAAHRFGTSESAPVDNAGKGGMIAPIDISMGTLKKAFVYEGRKFAGWHRSHPDTEEPIENVPIPDWHERLRNVLRMFDGLTWLDFCGPDIVFTNEGFVILEVNSMPDPTLHQIDAPLLADPSVKRFFESKGLVVR